MNEQPATNEQRKSTGSRARGLATLCLSMGLCCCGSGEADIDGLQQATHFRYATYNWTRESSVSTTNVDTTLCADGSSASTCRVSDFDFSLLGDAAPDVEAALEQKRSVVLGGSFVSDDGKGAGTFQIVNAWRAVDETTSAGATYSLAGEDLSCRDCELHAELLNTELDVHLQALDHSSLDLSASQLRDAGRAVSAGMLLASGELSAHTLRATQVWLPLVASKDSE